MKIRELRQKSKEELTKFLSEKRDQLLNLRFNLAGGRVKNVKVIRGTRKEIARALTLLENMKGEDRRIT